MKVKVLKEAGFEEALAGLALSYNSYPNKKVADRLAWRQGGHNKFLESMVVWIEVTAPRYWWSEADTYRLTTKQSESTMHTLMRRELIRDDFEERDVDSVILGRVNKYIREKEFLKAKRNLPEGFLQKRVWKVDYKTLQNIIMQRKSHRLPEWKKFVNEMRNQLEYPEYVYLEK